MRLRITGAYVSTEVIETDEGFKKEPVLIIRGLDLEDIDRPIEAEIIISMSLVEGLVELPGVQGFGAKDG